MATVTIKSSGSGTGNFTLEPPTTNTDRTVVLPDEAGTLAIAENISAGITRAEQWGLTTNKTSSGNITNVAEISEDGYSGLNPGMTQSSGQFSFPETGFWLVRFTAVFEEGSGGNDQPRFTIVYTDDNFATDAQGVFGFCGLTDPPNEFANTSTIEQIFNIDDVTNKKVRFQLVLMNTGNRLLGNSNGRFTNFTFIRLGDS